MSLMDQDTKKISFGFSKSIKKSNLIKPILKQEKVVQLIDCVEEQCIKVIGEADVEKPPLIIPLKRNKIAAIQLENDTKPDVISNDNKPVKCIGSTPTLDELAAQEIINDVQNTEKEKETRVFTIPSVQEKIQLEGEPESTLEDYENIPVNDFGLAMLRGMGWKEGKGIGKNQKVITTSIPVLRPKGMGLGADKIIKSISNTVSKDKNGEELQIVKGAFVKLLAGHFKDMYGQIEGLDDEGGRLIIKMALGGNNISVNEFVIQLITKEEFNKNSKVINSAKYEEYKKISQNKLNKCDNSTKKFNDDSANKLNRYNDESNSRRNSGSNIKSHQDYKKDKSEVEDTKYITSDSEDDKIYSEKNKSSQRHRVNKKDDEMDNSDNNQHKHERKHKKEKKKKHRHVHTSRQNDDYYHGERKHNKHRRDRSRSRTRR